MSHTARNPKNNPTLLAHHRPQEAPEGPSAGQTADGVRNRPLPGGSPLARGPGGPGDRGATPPLRPCRASASAEPATDSPGNREAGSRARARPPRVGRSAPLPRPRPRPPGRAPAPQPPPGAPTPHGGPRTLGAEGPGARGADKGGGGRAILSRGLGARPFIRPRGPRGPSPALGAPAAPTSRPPPGPHAPHRARRRAARKGSPRGRRPLSGENRAARQPPGAGAPGPGPTAPPSPRRYPEGARTEALGARRPPGPRPHPPRSRRLCSRGPAAGPRGRGPARGSDPGPRPESRPDPAPAPGP